MEAIDRILEKFPEIKGNLISILHEVQALENYLPEGSLRYLSQKTGVPLTQLYGVATFYHFFSLTPKGRHQIFVCLGTACHVKGSARILGEVKKRLAVEEGETTGDGRFTVNTVRCVGACSFAPVLLVDKDTHSNMLANQVVGILNKYE
ncbi:MAG: NAD(P)H-dependent oxidoreductase subunit E [Deltaproteobacteria bacterium]|nr:NAD(P)H-dependent oxidoreductase subunit E [Deltaproteobacteria bacterium]